jgi:hypothetical protein
MDNIDLDPNQVNETTFINDIRDDFRCITFSSHKKTQVKTELLESLIRGKIEQSCHWTAELVCSGHFLDIWEILLSYYGKYIHLANPKMAVYLRNRYDIFSNIIGQSIFTDVLQLRNNDKIRKLFAEIIVVVALSNKKHCIEPVKINRTEEFDITQMPERLKAPNIQYINEFFRPKDPKELFIAINEFSYAISVESKNTLTACYWIEWVAEFDAICKTRKQPCRCERRGEYPVENKYQMDIIWLIWDAILYYGQTQKDKFVANILNSLLSLFCIKYTTATTKKRRYILYTAVAIITEHVERNIEIVTASGREIVKTVTGNIDAIYKEIKKNEEPPRTQYLFMGVKEDKNKNITDSLRKMEMMNNMVATELKTPGELMGAEHPPEI